MATYGATFDEKEVSIADFQQRVRELWEKMRDAEGIPSYIAFTEYLVDDETNPQRFFFDVEAEMENSAFAEALDLKPL